MNKYRPEEVNSNKPQRPGCKTRQQIADEYGWSVQTLRGRLKDNKIDLPKGLISPLWQRMVYETLGYPPGVLKKEYIEV